MAPSAGFSLSSYASLVKRNRNFRRLWFAQIISELGDWMYMVVLYHQLLDLTGGMAKSIGYAFVVQVLPQMLTSPMTGVLNDRLSRRGIMIFSDWARAVIVAGMLLARTRDLLWLVYLLLFLETVCWGLFEPARNSVIPNITEGEDTVTANTLSAITWSFNFMSGFAVGGFLAAVAGRQTVFILNSLSFVCSALLIARMRFTEPHLGHQPPMKLTDLLDFSPLADGVRYVAADMRLLATMLVKFGLGLIGANWVLLTILGARKFPVWIPGLDPSAAPMLGMSFLLGSRGLGALLGPAIGNVFAGASQSRMRTGILIGFLASAAGYLALGQASVLPAACLALIFAHAGASVQWVFSTTLLQLNTEDRFRGRVFSTEFAFMTLSLSMSSAVAGNLLDGGVTPETVATYSGLVMLVPAVAWFVALRLWRQPSPS
ncbi:MAG: MFS transporter [Acidobacteria bacterium]|nr:MFS transporter [Acidobacteriota bacterium]